MSDLISRQAAIDILNQYALSLNPDKDSKELWKVKSIKSFIEQLPSAHPVITCDGCRFVGTYDTDPPCRCCIRREKD